MGSISRRRSSRAGRISALAAVALAVLGAAAVPASAAQPFAWSKAAPLSLLASPTGAEPEAVLFDISCTSLGSCAGVGAVGREIGLESVESSLSSDTGMIAKRSSQPIVASEDAGSWGAGSTLEGPEGAEPHKALLSSVSCTAPGQCVAVGGYEPAKSGEEVLPLGAVESGGKWSRPEAVELPANHEGKQLATLESVSCAAGGACTAVGFYDVKGEAIAPMVVTESGGRWGRATEVPTAVVGGSGGRLKSVSCAAQGSCSAVGTITGSKGAVPIAASESGGSWGAAAEVQLPTADATTPVGVLGSVSCTTPGDCTAVGSEESTVEKTTEGRLIAAQETAGVWSAAKQLGSTHPTIGIALPSLLTSVSCWSAGDCAAVGFQETFSELVYQPLVVASELNGSWTLEQAQDPEGTLLIAGFGTISCVSPGACLGTGFYVDGEEEYVTENETTKANETRYLPRVGAMTITAAPKLEAAAQVLPQGQVGVPYYAQLTATGGIGGAHWSIVTGSLPAGLTFDPSTGAVSGTPTEAGPSIFYAKVAEAGPPAQSVEFPEAMAIVAAKPSAKPPQVKILRRKLKAQGRSLHVEIACSNAPCKGKAKITKIVLLRLGRRGRHVVALRILLAQGSYHVAAGKRAVVVLRLTKDGRRQLARLARRRRSHPRTGPLRATLVVGVTGGRAAAAAVKMR